MAWYLHLVMIWVFATFLISIVAIVTSQSRWARLGILATFLVSLGLTFTAPFELLSRAKPADWAWLERDTEEAEIKGMELREGEGIYLLLIVEGEPRLYKFPWRQEFAENLMEATAAAEEQGVPAMLGKPFKGGGPLGQVADAVEGILEGIFGDGEGEGEGQGEGQGEGEPGEGEPGEGGNFSNSLEDRDMPFAYPKPQEKQPDKPQQDNGTRYDRGEDDDEE